MKILGLDPGTAITGYGLINADKGAYQLEEFGALRTPAGRPAHERLCMLYDALNSLLDRSQPDQVAIEQLFFNKNTTTAVPVGQARGVLLLACAQRQLPISEYTPLEVKQALTGYGRAEKRQVIEMVMRMMHITKKIDPDDAADALAIGLTAIYRTEHEAIYGRLT